MHTTSLETLREILTPDTFARYCAVVDITSPVAQAHARASADLADALTKRPRNGDAAARQRDAVRTAEAVITSTARRLERLTDTDTPDASVLAGAGVRNKRNRRMMGYGEG